MELTDILLSAILVVLVLDAETTQWWRNLHWKFRLLKAWVSRRFSRGED